MNQTGEMHKKKWGWKFILILLLLLLFGAVAKRLAKPEAEVVTTPLPTVSVGTAEAGQIEIETGLIGKLMPGNVYYVTPKAAGEILEIFVEQGDTVEQGEPICRIDNQKAIDAAKITLDGAKVSVDTYRDSVNTAKTNLDRMSALLASGDISSQAYDQAKAGYDQAAAGLRGAELQLEGAQLQYDTQLEFATVTAPVSGKVESESMELNALVGQSSQLCVISGESANKVQFSVTDRLLDAVSVGDPIRIEKQGSSYEGTVTSVATMADPQTGLYLIEAGIGEDSTIPAGANVKVWFVSERTEGALLVPTDAVYYDGGKNYIYTVSYEADGAASEAQPELENTTIMEGNLAATVHKREVEIGLSDTEQTEILSGLDEAEDVIVTWTNQLYEGARVQVLPPAEEIADGEAE